LGHVFQPGGGKTERRFGWKASESDESGESKISHNNGSKHEEHGPRVTYCPTSTSHETVLRSIWTLESNLWENRFR
jgi:hypothetical protein